MKEVRQPYELIQQLYAVLGREMPSKDTFALSGITITIDGATIEVSERGMVLPVDEIKIGISIKGDADKIAEEVGRLSEGAFKGQ